MSDRKPNTTCPLCEAAPGFPCLTWNGREREPHADRPSVPTPRIEDAAKAMMALDLYKPENADVVWAAFEPDEREHHLRRARAAAPILTADLSAEVQRLRGERDEMERAIESALNGLRLDAEGKEDVRQTLAQNLGQLCNETLNRAEAAESSLASLRASHDEVIRVVREWQEARKAKQVAWENDGQENVSADYLARHDAYGEAIAALAALDLGGAE